MRYTKEDFTRNEQKYDVIADTVGTAPYARRKDLFAENGRLLLVVADLPAMLQIPWTSMTTWKKIIAGLAPERPEDPRFLAEFARTGAFKPVIDRSYPFKVAVEAHCYVDSGRKRGSVLLRIKQTRKRRSDRKPFIRSRKRLGDGIERLTVLHIA